MHALFPNSIPIRLITILISVQGTTAAKMTTLYHSINCNKAFRACCYVIFQVNALDLLSLLLSNLLRHCHHHHHHHHHHVPPVCGTNVPAYVELKFLLYMELVPLYVELIFLLYVELIFLLYVELMLLLYMEIVFLSSDNLCRGCTVPVPSKVMPFIMRMSKEICLPSSQYTQEQTGYLFLRNRSHLTMSSLNYLCRTNLVHLDECMNYIYAGTLLWTKKSSVFILSTLLIVSWY
jgi:hypothetical protein